MSATPEPPYLVIRAGKAFWVEARHAGESSATLQAFKEGGFLEAWCYDGGGTLWPILAARLKRPPSLLERLFAWRRVPVQLDFGAPVHVGLPDVVSRLAKVLRSDNEFCVHLPDPPTTILRRFAEARTPGDIIRIARDYDEPAA